MKLPSVRWKTVAIISACLFAFLLTCSAAAQVDTGSILGTVKDQSGAVIPKAKVTLTNEDTGVTFVTTTGPDGNYVVAPLRIGAYKISVEATGFQKVEQEHASLSIQQRLVVDFTLNPGTLLQTIEVIAAPPQLQTQDASVGNVVAGGAVNNLPLNGRNFTFLAQLSAGVNIMQQDARGLSASGSFVANGQNYDQSNYLLDAIDDNSDQVDFLNGTSYSYRPSVDAIQEFKIQTSNYSAEFGRAAGAILNASVKSGTNQFHGDAWEFVRNSSLDAANFFENSSGEIKGEFRQNQFGASIGGPLTIPHVHNGKDRTFFFVDYEGTRIRQASPYLSTVPTANETNSGYTNLADLISGQSGTRTDLLGRTTPLGQVFDPATTRPVTAHMVDPVTGLVATGNGYVREPFAGNLIPSGRLDSNVVKLLNLYPPPNLPGLFNNYASHPIFKDETDQGDVRIDHRISDSDQLFVRASFSQEPSLIPGPFPGKVDGGGFNTGTNVTASTNDAFSWTHTFSPSMVNELRAGFNRVSTSRTQPSANDLSNIPGQFGIQGIPQSSLNGGLPWLSFAGLTPMGSSPWHPTWEITASFQLTENLTKISGKHTLKGGFSFQHVKNQFFQPAWSRGEWDFNGTYTEVPTTGGGNTGLAQALLTPIPATVANGIDNGGGASTIYASNISTPDATRDNYAAYFQDNWKVSPKLTVDLGLRWDFVGHFEDSFNAQTNFVPGPNLSGGEFMMMQSRCKQGLSPLFLANTALDGISITCSNNPTLVDTDKKNFSPRIGLAYHLAPKVVLRSGYGIFYGTPTNGDTLNYLTYPYYYSFVVPATDPVHPIVFTNGSLGTLETGFTGVAGVTNSSLAPTQGLGLWGAQVNWHTPYTQDWNFMLEFQASPNQTFTLGYVGTKGTHLQMHSTSNEVTQILPPSTNYGPYLPYPLFGAGQGYMATEADSRYHGLQATFERRFSQGLNLLANYTYSKCRTDDRSPLNNNLGSYRAPLVPGFGIQGDYSLCDADIPQVVHFSGGYALPFGKGQKFLHDSTGVANQLAGGWHLNWILTLQDGQPFTVGCVGSYTAELGCNALLVPGQNVYAGKHNVNQWMNPAAFTSPPVATTIGQSDYAPLGGASTQLLGPGFHRMDLSIFKDFPIRETTRLEFRAEFFNLTNTPQFSIPGFSFPSEPAAPGSLDYTNTVQFGKITSTRDGGYDQREIQFALKLYW